MTVEHAKAFLKVLEQKKWLMEHSKDVEPHVSLEELEKTICYWLELIKELQEKPESHSGLLR